MGKSNHLPIKIVLTGGPGGGKTTALDLIGREFPTQVACVSEAATLLYSSGIRRHTGDGATRAIQKAIYFTQIAFEDLHSGLNPKLTLLCDRGTVDGAAYWPKTGKNFFETIGSSLEAEFQRYDAVIFFETAAAGKMSIAGNNPYRIENRDEAIEVDRRLRSVWKSHPRYTFIPHSDSFFSKLQAAMDVIKQVAFRPA